MSITPIKNRINPFAHEISLLKGKRLIYYPNNILYTNRGKSDDKINKNIKYTHTPILKTQLKKYKNGYLLSPLHQLKHIKYKALSLDKPNKMKNKYQKNEKRNNKYLILLDNNKKDEKQNSIVNTNINLYDTENRQKSPFSRNITILNNKRYKIDFKKKKTIDSIKERIFNKPNLKIKNICHKNNNYNTIQKNQERNNNTNPIYINTNFIYNCQINNEYRNDKIKKEINKDKNKIKKGNKKSNNEKYIPLNIRSKHQFKESEDITAYSEKLRTISTIDESLYNKNIIKPRKKKDLKTIFIGNTNIKNEIKGYK